MVVSKRKIPADVEEPADDTKSDLFERFIADLTHAIPFIEKLIISKATQYTGPAHRHDEMRKDRATLLGKLHVAFAERVEGQGEHAREGLYVSEMDLSLRYREKIRNGGLFMLPTVVQVEPADASGNVTAIVEFALADTDGHYWPAAVRVAGTGNDRLVRGVTGDQALPRALSAAWKEAVCRIAFLGRPHDPEDHTVPLDPVPGSRPSNSQGQRREPAMTLKEEDETKARIIAKLEEYESTAEIDALMGHKATTDFLAKVSSRTRQAIEQVAAQLRQRTDYGRSGSRRDVEGRQERHASSDYDTSPEGGRDDNRRAPTYTDPDDDIPF